MTQPLIEIIPLRPAVCSDAPVSQHVLVRITPPVPDTPLQRPALNLGLVLDRSGSMKAQNKIGFARDAAIYAIQQLLPTDRVSVTVFDDEVEIIVPNTPAQDRARIVDVIQGIDPGGSTALYDGWRESGRQVRQHLLAGSLNRVLLLSDGLANMGETDPDTIASDVHRLAREGISTTTLGLGDHYNEDLLEAMARSGDGNYYYIESPQQLTDIFQTELMGLMAAIGNTVCLGIEPQGEATLAEVLNDLDRLPTGPYQLPNLVAGMPLLVVLRLTIPPQPGESEVCRFRLAWSAPGQSGRQEMTVALRLPAVDAATWETLVPNVEVQERAALLRMARCKKEATRCLEGGDGEEAQRWLKEARQTLASTPTTAETGREEEALAQIEEHLADGAWDKFRKRAKYQSHQRSSSKPYQDPPATPGR